MSLNIKNPQTLDLISHLAQATGQTKTAAVTGAVSAQLDSLTGREPTVVQRRAQIARLLEEIDLDMSDAERARLSHAEADLFDGAGLPQ